MAASDESVAATVRAFLRQSFPGHDIPTEQDIFGLGFVTSLFALQLVEFLEHRFAIEVENEDLELDNFRTIAAITRFVGAKTAAEPRA